MIIPEPSQDEIDAHFILAVQLHREHLLSKTGEMYPFNPDNLQEAIAEMSEEQKVTLAAYAETILDYKFAQYFRKITNEYWEQCAGKKSFEVVQKNFDPLNMR